jgi:hypothetical protein
MLRVGIGFSVAVALAVAACGGASAPTTVAATEDAGTAATTTVAAPETSALTPPTEAARVCSVLDAAPFERRRTALANLVDPGEVESLCREALARTEAAVLVNEAALLLGDKEIGDLESQLACSGETFSWTVTNTFDVAIGLYGIAELHRVEDGADAARLGSPDAAAVWRLEPGETTVLDGVFPPHEGNLDRCSVAGWFFVADTDELSGDAAVPGSGGNVGDDPSVWLPILYQRQRMYDVTGDAELVETFEDLRSVAYPRLVADVADDADRSPTESVPGVRVCTTVADDGDGATGVVYEVSPSAGDDGAADPYLVFGVFRRGADGMWRWLGSSVRWTSPNLTTCEEWAAASDA